MMKVTFIGQHCSKCLTSMISFNSLSSPIREACCDPCLVNEGPKTCPDLTAMNGEPGGTSRPSDFLPSLLWDPFAAGSQMSYQFPLKHVSFPLLPIVALPIFTWPNPLP